MSKDFEMREKEGGKTELFIEQCLIGISLNFWILIFMILTQVLSVKFRILDCDIIRWSKNFNLLVLQW